jgi:hypothetical protein
MSETFRDRDFGFLIVGSSVEGRHLREPVFEMLRLSVEYLHARCIGGVYGAGLRDGQGHPDSLAAIARLSRPTWKETGTSGAADLPWFGYASPA